MASAAPATATAGAAASTSTSTSTDPTAGTTAPAGAGTGGPGSLTVGITSPVSVAGHVNTPVSCEVAGRRYAESATGVVNGATVAESVRVAGYTGPGSYAAVVTVSLVANDASRYAIDAVPATVEITSTGGSVSFSASTYAGRTLAGSINWACS
ncbi:hypothetical protein [Pseudofrankia saprophytica]|uniref:hypothetical protein n=1 Tax=Pseudofrankia saprophytica TaxID=298655 RepID=UPI0002E29B6D|nr:hypothetical protein [Pseudofrankia saprophytica]